MQAMNLWKKFEDVLSPWEALLWLSIGYIAVDIPLGLAFGHSMTHMELSLDLIISGIFAYDQLRYPIRGIKALNSKYWHYAEVTATWPWVSMIAALGFSQSHWLIYIQAIRFLRIPRLISHMQEKSKDKIMPKRFKFVAAGFITIVVLNTFACGWLTIYPPQADAVTEYIKATYWLVTTIATVGYGDITPTNNLGRVYAMFMMIMGATIWGILIASASRMMLASDHRKEKRKEKMEALHSFFTHYEIPKPLQGQVIGFYNHLLTQKISEDERAVLAELPAALQGELQSYMNLKPISKVVLFQGVSFTCLSQASKKLEQAFFAPGEVIIKQGEIGQEMYLIGHGSVTVHIGDQFITNLNEGQCFGEFALIGDGIRATDVTAATYCDVFKLSKDKFDELYKAHSDLRLNIEKIVQERNRKKNQPQVQKAS
jgi:hypothetical protein